MTKSPDKLGLPQAPLVRLTAARLVRDPAIAAQIEAAERARSERRAHVKAVRARLVHLKSRG